MYYKEPEKLTPILFYNCKSVLQNPFVYQQNQGFYITYTYEQNTVIYRASATQNGLYCYTYCLNNPLKYTDPSGEFIGLVLGGAIIGGYIGGLRASGEWNPFNWSSSDWQAAGIGAIVGAGAGAGLAFATAATGLGTTAWSVTSNALIMGNMNMAFTAAAGGNRDEVFKSGRHGMATGAALAGLSKINIKYSTTGNWGDVGLFLAKRNAVNNIDACLGDDDFRISAGVLSYNINQNNFTSIIDGGWNNKGPVSFTQRLSMLYETAGMISHFPNKPLYDLTQINASGNSWAEGGKSLNLVPIKTVANAIYNNSIMDYFFDEDRIINSYLTPNKANYPMNNMFREGISSWWDSINSFFR